MSDNITIGSYELSQNMNWLCIYLTLARLWVQTLVDMN